MLNNNDVGVWIPVETVLKRHKRRAATRHEVSALPGIVFIDENDLFVAENLMKKRLVSRATPLIINRRHASATLDELRKMDEFMREKAEKQAISAQKPRFLVGDAVRVVSGPFTGAAGIVVGRNGTQRVVLQTDFTQNLAVDACSVEHSVLHGKN